MNIHELTHTHTWGRMYTEFSINNVQLLLACEIVVAYFSAPLPTQRVATLLLLCACLCVSVAQIASLKHTHILTLTDNCNFCGLLSEQITNRFQN